jgi:hypothetical protein
MSRSTQAAPRLPAGWRVEEIGAINAVEFTHRDRAYTLLWTDGRWAVTHNGHARFDPPGLPPASTQDEARRIGTRFIQEVEDA